MEMHTAEKDVGIWYTRWKLLQEWKVSCKKYGEKVVYEINAIRERHCVTSLCYRGSSWLEQTDFSKLIEEVKSCKKIERRDQNEVLNGIIANITQMRNVVDAKPIDVKRYSCGNFRPKLGGEQMRYLDMYNPLDVMAMLLRYECLCPQGQQWAVPKKWIAEITKAIGLDIVAFASPLNTQIEQKQRDAIRTKYYSGYTEDAAFGSQGSFLNMKPEVLDDFAGRTCVIEANPPFVESILLDAVKLFERLFAYASEMESPPQLTILFVTPDWSDAEFYEYVTNPSVAPYLRTVQLQPGEHAYENATAEMTITSRQRSKLFVLSNDEKLDFPLNGFKIAKERIAPPAPKGRGVQRR